VDVSEKACWEDKNKVGVPYRGLPPKKIIDGRLFKNNKIVANLYGGD
jgi:hypothetical protein